MKTTGMGRPLVQDFSESAFQRAGGEIGSSVMRTPVALWIALAIVAGGATIGVSPNSPPGGIYPCQPGGPNDYVYLMTSRANPEHWPRLLKLVGRERPDSAIRATTLPTPACSARPKSTRSSPAGRERAPSTRRGDARLSAVGVPAGAVLDFDWT